MATENPDTSDGLDGEELIITRSFDASRERVWQAFSEADRLAQWWGPKGFSISVAKLEFRPGGIFHYCMKTPAGQEMWGKFVYRDIAAPERIVFINSFSDPQGGLTRNPWAPSWPLEVLNTLTLVEEAGKTQLTLRGGPINANELERSTFKAGIHGMRQGFGGTWDQLEAYLARG